MEKKIITISREFGSGGRTIGRQLAEKLGIPFYDEELVDQVALESGFAPKFIEEHSEHSPGKSFLSYVFAPQGVPGVMNGLSTADFLWSIQCNVILQLADKGPCVIVGRNADYVLKDREDCLHASSMRIWAIVQNVLSVCMVNLKRLQKHVCRKRISAVRSTISTIPAVPGVRLKTMMYVFAPANWVKSVASRFCWIW